MENDDVFLPICSVVVIGFAAIELMVGRAYNILAPRSDERFVLLEDSPDLFYLAVFLKFLGALILLIAFIYHRHSLSKKG